VFLFNFLQIGHIQYLSTLIKDDRKIFRKKFGIQFLLDVIRVHYSTCPVLSKDDCKTIRGSLFGLVKFYLQKDVSSKDVLPIVNFILSVKQEGKTSAFYCQVHVKDLHSSWLISSKYSERLNTGVVRCSNCHFVSGNGMVTKQPF
jgi:hypothetical protein